MSTSWGDAIARMVSGGPSTPNVAMTIEKGNTIQLDTDDVTSREIQVKWQQSLANKQQTYYLVPIRSSDGSASSILFVQQSYMDDFKGTLSGKTFTVDEKFQYAQGKGTNASRWLVYHDRNQKAYQWRFVEGVLSKFGDGSSEFLNPIGVTNTDLKMIVPGMSDFLRNF